MSRKCDITGVGVMSGHKVSKSNIKTKRRFLPNLQYVNLRSDILNCDIKLRVSVRTLRTIYKHGDIDHYLLSTRASHLTEEALKIKHAMRKRVKKKAQASAI